ncbi:hypothetical protein IST4116A_01243 [Burkholderia cenocepacia]|uniref:hypothetical protein n=1 Tax=Burkholderia cenocepacia TaxID=95486 RepID=UPI0019C44165|nr:hypothetical protein [Burkholderia cenocepacia]CAB5083465.1 hypothetical protein IST4116B_01235 [Burkholderia cenocepacia]CAB5084128.1 hypothetical protein IST4134_01244 [Burkholderia cenocepacia]CAB5088167.1 hypothetical protein IST4113_01242 [Burkholderia cenocepacia]CAB5096227.1 hypothetical protein IST439_01282 [Burkholderia cenocepacia]CAB5105688.1 hypothetical protein IST4129_01243 [Burkholderia cenocepacia]
MSKYEKLDALIVASIDETPKKFAAVNTGAVREESERLAREECRPTTFGEVVGWRIVDRRLQAVRKTGKIRSTSKGWVRA